MTTVQLFQWVTFASLLFWLLVYWQAGLKILPDIRSSAKSRDSKKDLTLLIVIAALSFVITMTAFLIVVGREKFGFPHPLEIPAWLTIFRCLLSILGIAGTFYCRHQLGRLWIAETALKKDHRVMDHGHMGSSATQFMPLHSSCLLAWGLSLPPGGISSAPPGWCWLICSK